MSNTVKPISLGYSGANINPLFNIKSGLSGKLGGSLNAKHGNAYSQKFQKK